MTHDHTAFAFDEGAFRRELAPLLDRALESGETSALDAFIDDHRAALADPSTGEPLSEDWRTALSGTGVQRLAAVALTSYYDPGRDIGLGAGWQTVRAALTSLAAPARAFVTGGVFGPTDRPLRPDGRTAYLQSAEYVRQSVAVLEEARTHFRAHADQIDPTLNMLRTAAAVERGLLVLVP
jgi:hypothetical protein